MKNLLFFAIVICSCSKAQLTTKAIKNNFGEPLFQEFKGNVVLKKTTNNSILLFIDSANSNSGKFNTAILLESDKAFSSLDIENGEYEIYIPKSRRNLVISSLDKNLVLHIGLFDDEEKIRNISKKFEIAIKQQTYLGYGLSYMKSHWDKKLVSEAKVQSSDDILVNTDIHLLEKGITSNSVPAVTCHSGGAGSSSCSVEEGFPTTQVCSVSCNAGYFACCNTSTFKCKCYVNGTAEN
ncbi:MAG: hypothetical protein H7Y86_15055 [Rhizobacter sp.]|nr:hypothetical protein [Ferruginibacter sp.]